MTAESRYTVTGALGRQSKYGGVSVATDEAGRKVTLKYLDHYGSNLPELLGRLRGVAVPEVAPVREWFRAADGRLCIVREWVEGTDLKSLMLDKKHYGHVEEDNFLRAGEAVCRALEAVHGAGIIHRDVKPSNIVVRHPEGLPPEEWDYAQATLIDFEQMAAYPPDGASRTAFALVYSPPEMVLRRADLTAPGSDLFALGITLYQLIMGKSPYTDCNPEVLLNLQLTYPVKKPARMTDELFAVIERACHKAPFRLPPRRLAPEEVTETLRRGLEGRYQRAADMAADLASVPHALRKLNWLQRALG